MTDEQLSAILTALHSVELAIQNGTSTVLQGPVPVTVGQVELQTAQLEELTQRLYVIQGLEVIAICFIGLVAGVCLGNILSRWFR